MANTLSVNLSTDSAFSTLGEFISRCDDLKSYDAIDMFCDFEEEKAAEEVLSGIEKLDHLAGLVLYWRGTLSSLDIISPLVNLRHIKLHQLHNLSNIDALKTMPKLKHLDFYSCEGLSSSVYDGLEHLTVLESLYLEDINDLETLAFVNRVPNLSSLYIQGVKSLFKIGSIDKLANIEYLDFSPGKYDESSNPYDFKNLSQFFNLKKIDIQFRFNVFDMDWILGCKLLEHISFTSPNPIRNLRFLNDLPNLKSVTFYDCLGKVDREGYKKEIIESHPSINFEFSN